MINVRIQFAGPAFGNAMAALPLKLGIKLVFFPFGACCWILARFKPSVEF